MRISAWKLLEMFSVRRRGHLMGKVLRCITDTAANSGLGNFEDNSAKASGIAGDITAALLKELANGMEEKSAAETTETDKI